ncbi:RusA family crossover junction endodeoxyribonuclease [Phaeospirillum tilakii]|uniref:RusA family crossover junction endodeoxyribonuclease n=1 Tax=Phaeospirillum tilakii TaxID=741673 RepID=A0ABW5C6M8_9PROT
MPDTPTPEVRLVIHGEPASKANSRRIVPRGKRFASIKSDKALGWLERAEGEIPRPDRLPFPGGEVVAFIAIYYATHRPDLDESLVLDFLQGRVYANDRQVRERHTYHFIDRDNPRVEVVVRPRAAA